MKQLLNRIKVHMNLIWSADTAAFKYKKKLQVWKRLKP